MYKISHAFIKDVSKSFRKKKKKKFLASLCLVNFYIIKCKKNSVIVSTSL